MKTDARQVPTAEVCSVLRCSNCITQTCAGVVHWLGSSCCLARQRVLSQVAPHLQEHAQNLTLSGQRATFRRCIRFSLQKQCQQASAYASCSLAVLNLHIGSFRHAGTASYRGTSASQACMLTPLPGGKDPYAAILKECSAATQAAIKVSEPTSIVPLRNDLLG